MVRNLRETLLTSNPKGEAEKKWSQEKSPGIGSMQKKVGKNDTHASETKAAMAHISRGSRSAPAVFTTPTSHQASVISQQHDLVAT